MHVISGIPQAVAGMAENRAYQAKVGSAIADNTDNQYLAYVARNETIQVNMRILGLKHISNYRAWKLCYYGIRHY